MRNLGVILIALYSLCGSETFADIEGKHEVAMIPVSVSRQISDNYQVDILTIGSRQIISIQAAQLIENIRKIHKAVPSALLEKRQDKVTLEELTVMGFYCLFDEEKVQIEINLPVDPNNPDSLSIGNEHEFFRDGEKVEQAPISGYINTSATAGFRRDQEQNVYGDPSMSRFDGVLNVHGYVFEGSETLQDGAPAQRDDVRVTKEINVLDGMRVSAGDLFYPVLGYQTYRKIGGVAAYTIRDQKHGFLSSRTSQKQIEVKQPSTLTFFVNEQPVATRRVLPGLYDISDIPLATGVNRIRVLVEAEGTGQREEIVFDDFFSDYGIKQGQRDFAVALGEKSTDAPGARLYHPENQTLMINHRYDLSNQFSWSQYYQGDQDAQLAGMIEAYHVPGGYIQLDSAASNWIGAEGLATRIGYFKTRPDEFYLLKGDRYSVNLEQKFAGFSSLDLAPQPGQTDVSVAYTFPTWKKYSFGVGGSYGIIDATDQETYTYSGNISRAMGNFYITANAAERYAPDVPGELTIGLSLNWSPGERSYYANTQQTGQSENTTHIAMNTSRDQDVKGSITETTDPDTKTTSTQVTGTTNRNEMTFSGERVESRFDDSYVEHFALNTRFAVAFAGTKVGIGRPISDSFFLSDTKHDNREYEVETWGHHSETGAMGEALVGFQNYPNNTAHVTSGDIYGKDIDSNGTYNVENSWKGGYLLKIKQQISPTVMTIISKDIEDLKNTVMKLKNIETGETSEFFVSSSGEVFIEGVESGLYEFTVGSHSGRFKLDVFGGRKELDLDPSSESSL